jgi:hypothetical protein
MLLSVSPLPLLQLPLMHPLPMLCMFVGNEIVAADGFSAVVTVVDDASAAARGASINVTPFDADVDIDDVGTRGDISDDDVDYGMNVVVSDIDGDFDSDDMRMKTRMIIIFIFIDTHSY